MDFDNDCFFIFDGYSQRIGVRAGARQFETCSGVGVSKGTVVEVRRYGGKIVAELLRRWTPDIALSVR